MKILHFLWSGDVGGAERAVYLLVREQLKDVSLQPSIALAKLSGFYGNAISELGCPTVVLNVTNGRSFHRLPNIIRQIRPFDLHHFHIGEPLFMIASLFCRGVKRVYTHRGGLMDYSWRKKVRYSLVGYLLRQSFHGLSGNTAHGAKSAATLFSLPPECVQVTYNGLEFDLLVPKRSVIELRVALQLQPYHLVIGTSANLKDWKRIHLLLESVAQIEDKNVRLLIVGDGPERLRLENLTDQTGIRERVIFAGKQTHIADYLQLMDIFCLPSSEMESFGNASVEAMALNIPTIVFADGGGLVEHIEAGKTGYIVHTVEELAQTVRYLAQNPDVRKQIGLLGSIAVRDKYTLARCASRYNSLYATAISA